MQQTEEFVNKKNAIRQQIRLLKKNLPTPEKENQSIEVFKKLELTTEFIEAKTILLYYSLSDEVCTHQFIDKWKDKKTILLPIIEGDKMFVGEYTSESHLQKGEYGIMSPTAQQKFTAEIELAIIPGIAFDKQKNRLGRGKGYYDRFLEKCKTKKIGICYDFQLLDAVPTNINDIRMDVVISSTKLF